MQPQSCQHVQIQKEEDNSINFSPISSNRKRRASDMVDITESITANVPSIENLIQNQEVEPENDTTKTLSALLSGRVVNFVLFLS